MKFSIVAFVAFVSMASAKKTRNLEQESSIPVGLPKAKILPRESLEARVQIGGVQQALSKEDLTTLDEVLVKTFNQSYQDLGSELTKSESKSAILLDEDDLVAVVATSFIDGDGAWCRFCIIDDDDPDLYWSTHDAPIDVEFLAQFAGKFHNNFEKKMCKELRKTGLANFAQAKDCSFSFLEHPGTPSKRVPEANAYESLAGLETDAQLTMLGLLHLPTVEEMQFIEKVIVDTHNKAFAKTGYELNSFETVSSVDAGNDWWIPQCKQCDKEDKNSPLNDVTLVFAHATPISFRKEEDRMGEYVQLAYIHHNFEGMFCAGLKTSGYANFANVHDCNFRFVYNPIGEASTKAQASASY